MKFAMPLIWRNMGLLHLAFVLPDDTFRISRATVKHLKERGEMHMLVYVENFLIGKHEISFRLLILGRKVPSRRKKNRCVKITSNRRLYSFR